MRVFIGGYLNHVSLYGALRRLGIDWFAITEKPWYGKANKVYDKLFNWRKRVEIVKIDEYDTWSCDSTLSKIIVPLLKKFIEDPTSVPMDMYPLVDDSGNPAEEYEGQALQNWKDTVGKMIWSFEKVIEGPDYSKSIEEIRAEDVKVQEGIDLFAKYFRNLWD